jgi:hypothetical protein
MLPLSLKLRALDESRASTRGTTGRGGASQLPRRFRPSPGHQRVDQVRISPSILGSCLGYLVDSPDGRIGTVTRVRYDPHDRATPAALLVRSGRSGLRLFDIPVSELTAVRVAQRRVILRGSPRITASEAMTTDPATP